MDWTMKKTIDWTTKENKGYTTEGDRLGMDMYLSEGKTWVK